MIEQLTADKRFTLYNLISDTFNVDELKELAFRLGIDDEDLERATKGEFVQEIIFYNERRRRIGDLLSALAELRPMIDWPTFEVVKAQEHFPIFYQEPGIVSLPPKFLGRGSLLVEAGDHIKNGRKVLLHGIIGSGKTALAAKIANDFLEQIDGCVIWFTIDDLEADPLFDALAQRLGTSEEQQEIRRVQNAADQIAVRKILKRYEPMLVVLDNAQNGATLRSVLRALPETMPALVTSQLVFSLPELTFLPVGDLSPEDAMSFFSYYAGQDYSEDELAQELIQTVAYHPYSLEIAGAVVRADGRVLRRRLEKIAEAPTKLTLPFDEKPGVAALLLESYAGLSPTAQAVFRMISCLFVPDTTPELMALLLEEEVDKVWEALDELAYRSMARRQVVDWFPAGSGEIVYYAFHELTYHFSRIQFQTPNDDRKPLPATIRQFGEDLEWEPDFIRAEIGNVMVAAQAAQQEGDWDNLVAIVSGLALHGYLDTYGYTREFLDLLDAIIPAVREMGKGERVRLHYLLGKRGNAYNDSGQLAEARQMYKEALGVAPNSRRQIMALAILGRVSYQMEDYTVGDDYFARGHQALEEEEDVVALGFLRQQQSVAKGIQGDYEASRNFANDAVQINRQFAESNPPRLLYSLLNLGTAEERLGNLDKAIEIHREGYEMALEKGIKRLAADMGYSLAQDLHALGQDEQVMEKLQEARQLYHDVGDVAYEQAVIEYMKNMDNGGENEGQKEG